MCARLFPESKKKFPLPSPLFSLYHLARIWLDLFPNLGFQLSFWTAFLLACSCYLVSSFAFSTGCVASEIVEWSPTTWTHSVGHSCSAGVAATAVGQFIRLLTSFSTERTVIRVKKS